MQRRPPRATRTDTLCPCTALFRSAWADICKPAELAYRIGRESAIDRLLLDTARPADEAASLKLWEKPVLPIGGGVLVKKGLRAGPDVACALQRVEAIWIDENYTDPALVNAIADEVRAEERRVGKEGGSKFSNRWCPV